MERGEENEEKKEAEGGGLRHCVVPKEIKDTWTETGDEGIVIN